MGTAYDNWLNQGSDGPKELDEEAMEGALMQIACGMELDGIAGEVAVIYNAGPALNHALREVVFPEHLRPYIVALANLSADIRAKVDDEYAARTATYDDPRD